MDDNLLSEKTILVSIISHREHELENTVKEFYTKSKYPDRLRFSVVSQDDKHPALDFVPDSQIRYLRAHHKEVYGVCWARSIAARMFNDYDYYFQIDAHMFPSQDWDDVIISTHEKAKERFGNNVLLTAIPARYILESNKTNRTIMGLGHAYADIKNKKLFEWGTVTTLKEQLKEIFYVQGACMFSEGRIMDEIQIDPEIPYQAEEISYSIRCFAAGYKIVAFKKPVFYHLFSDDRKEIGIFNDPWEDPKSKIFLTYDSFKDRSSRFFETKISGKLGVTKNDLISFCKKSGFSIPNLDL
jgi:hypothetical protein